MKTYKLHLIRHGLTQGNEEGIYMGGGTDMPLSPRGIEELQRLKSTNPYPRADVLYSSPMKRALQTAEILYPQARDKTIVEDLRECRFGVYEGRKAEELMKDENFRKWMDPASNFVPEGGESGEAFAHRTAKALLAILEDMAKKGVFEGVCIAHGGVIMTALAQIGIPKPREIGQLLLGNGHGFTVQTDAGMLMRDQLVEIVDSFPH